MIELILSGVNYTFGDAVLGIDLTSWLSVNDERERLGLVQRDCRRTEMCGSITADNLSPRCMRMAFSLGQISI